MVILRPEVMVAFVDTILGFPLVLNFALSEINRSYLVLRRNI